MQGIVRCGLAYAKVSQKKQLSINKKIPFFLLAVSARWHLQRYSFEPHFIYTYRSFLYLEAIKKVFSSIPKTPI
jgi:hypothetical protein